LVDEDEGGVRQTIANWGSGRLLSVVRSTGAVEELSLDEAKALFETNFFGVVRMVKAVLPSQQVRRGRVY
jgi:NAD(P)-dependent dehydrogenase (short-subunit alcohol dehydrogenase family)